jgi:NAD(P)H dehydrogenase (quinone)
MRVLYVYCHPLPESFHAAIRAEAVAALARAGHEVDLLDLYAEGFDPVLSAEGRRAYHDTMRNRVGLEAYVARLQACEAIVLQFPTWCFGLPAMLKGYFDRLMMPGVSIDLSEPGNVRTLLGNIRKIAGISTYGRPRWMALYMGDPPRAMVTRYMKRLTGGTASAEYHALYHMNVATDAQRRAFIARVATAMARF